MTNAIYFILNLRNHKFYIGSAKNPHSRVHSHFRSLRQGSHHSPFLQRSWDKYGEEAFTWFLHASELDNLREVEQRYLDFYFENHRERLLNVSPRASGGYIVGSLPNAEEIHRRGAEKMLGRTSPLRGLPYAERYGAERAREIVEKMRSNLGDRSGENNSFFGRSHSEEFCRRQAERMRGVSPVNKGTNGPGRRCEIMGIEYISVSQASREIGMTRRKVITRLKSPEYPEFRYLE